MIYRKAELRDSEMIMQLNHKFYQAFLKGDTEYGFLKNEFSLYQIRSLIEKTEVVVAEKDHEVIGYYLINSIFETETVTKRKLIVSEFISTGKIKDAQFVYLTQAVVDKPHMGKGVGKELLKHLKRLVTDRFDYLIGYIDFQNLHAKEAHLRSGWVIFAEMGTGWLAMNDVNAL